MKTRVKSCYRIVYTGRRYRQLRKENPDTPKEVIVDINDWEDVAYLFNVYLMDRGVKIYLELSDGARLRIKTYGLFRSRSGGD